ncbi:hypothetical protein [Paucibacter sp. XJ19-41]|uniref:hypothetical protein n=1 Tax=Paucibacter sp. XJ19-41 TaxID=2927824 RepID=UPI00234A5051|nr:hypothetical protein [Paucibacter sp. XJ19-41]MDC6168527.1 hypothetical protein [Paucibacter sp. XJ19-41]
MKEEIDHAADKLSEVVKTAAREIGEQRRLTKEDMQDLVRLAAQEFGTTLDQRIEKAKHETSELLTYKLAEFTGKLRDAAEIQKKTAVRNASVGVVAAIAVSLVSLLTKKHFGGSLDALDVYRTVMFSIAAGYLAVMVFRVGKKYFSAPDLTRNSVVVGATYLEILRPKGLGMHAAIILVALLGWLALNQFEAVSAFFQQLKH